MLLSCEQSIVDDTRRTILGADLPAGPKVAGMMLVARHAYRAGLRHGQQNGQEPDVMQLVKAELPTVTSMEGTKSVNEVYLRIFNAAVEDETSRGCINAAFSTGQIDNG